MEQNNTQTATTYEDRDQAVRDRIDERLGRSPELPKTPEQDIAERSQAIAEVRREHLTQENSHNN